MSMVDDLRNMLIAHGIDATSYTDSMLDSFIFEAKLLVDMPFMFDNLVEDYEPTFSDDIYMTEDYPVRIESVQISVNGETVTPKKITEDGIIYFKNKISGELVVKYIVGLNDEDINQYLLPLVLYIIKDTEGQNISSITEGDISISYDNNNGVNAQMTSLIENLRSKYSGRVEFI